jgi:glycine betaine/choline ABC-type transport system substrate-binding protein
MIDVSVDRNLSDVFVLMQSPGALHHKEVDVLAKYYGSGSTSSGGSSTAAKTSQTKTQLTARNGLASKNNNSLQPEVSSHNTYGPRGY